MGTYSKFKTNISAETEGAWFDLGEAGRFKIARSGGNNREYLKIFNRRAKPHKQLIDAGKLGEDENTKFMTEVFAEANLKGWDGVTDENGEVLAYSFENAVKLLTDLPDLFLQLLTKSQDMNNYREEVLAESLKNSGPSSSMA